MSNNSSINALFDLLHWHNVLWYTLEGFDHRFGAAGTPKASTALRALLQSNCSQGRRSIITASKVSQMVRRRRSCWVLVACATALRPAAHVRRRVEPRYAEDGCEAAEGDVVVFALPDTVDPPGTPGERRLGVVKAEMSCTAWVHPLVEQGADQGEDEVMLVEDEAFEEPIQCQGGIESIIDDVFYGQLPVPSLGGGVGYGATAVECWTLVRDQVPDGVDVPVSDSGVAPWTH